MSSSPGLYNSIKAFIQLGPRPVILNVLYRLGLASGWYRRTGKVRQGAKYALQPLFNLPPVDELKEILGDSGAKSLLKEADEIVAGRVRLFGGQPVTLRLSLPGKLEHWTVYEKNPDLLAPFYEDLPDVKFIWEPARFGWAFTLGRAFYLKQDEKYAEAFWHHTEIFLDANSPYLGPHWMSAQEVAIRLMTFIWSAQVFSGTKATTPQRLSRLAEAVAEHAERIPPTLIYARSQGNNHLLTEAAGLLTAGQALPDHPRAARWCARGFHVMDNALQTQIDSYGEYTQHSTNYHRLMLQVALWVNALCPKPVKFSFGTRKKLAAATHWLLSLLDSESGGVPNLGANDGASIFPLTICPFADFRPVVHAAARAFLEYDLPHGVWDECALWFNLPVKISRSLQLPRYLGDNLYGENSWAALRTAQFTSRPSHADQLHLDLWWRGINITLDPGTYLYNAPAPWENSLTTARVHNTVTVNGRDQMTRAGRFLYLDWVNAFRIPSPVPPDGLQSISGRYRVFRGDGYRHTRSVVVFPADRWLVTDEVIPMPFPFAAGHPKPMTVRLHWLLPDWKWEMQEKSQKIVLRIKSPRGWVTLSMIQVSPSESGEIRATLVRAGEVLRGSIDIEPIRGWYAPTYGVKVPALSLAVTVQSGNPVQFTSEFRFP